ncbi:MAG: recombinase family protein [Phycisphaerales bacterium]
MTKAGQSKPKFPVRCAIYTRKSTEEGLEQEFNSLDAQRESAEAYVASQKGEGWVALPDRYDDGGFTGGNMERPAVKRLMADIEAGRVDCVVVYKVDRLSRSLIDFARMMEVFERKRVSFVSVTQQFNTTQSMGRLTLNILLSFAQFEREIISERTRDKIAAARRKGKWSGGRSILGYDVDPQTKRLVVNQEEAEVVLEVFKLYLDRKSLLDVARELNRRGLRTKAVRTRRGRSYGGREWDKGAVLKILSHVLYRGRVRYKSETYAGEHEAIVQDDLWNEVHGLLRSNGRSGGTLVRNKHGALLKGLLYCGPCGVMMGHTTTNKGKSRVYRYYVCYKAQKQGWDSCPCRSVPADQIEGFVVGQIKRIARDPELLSLTLAKCGEQAAARRKVAEEELERVERDQTRLHADLESVAGDAASSHHAAARLAELHERVRVAESRASALRNAIAGIESGVITKAEVDAAHAEFDGVWARLSPREQARLIRMLIQRVDFDVAKASVSITFHPLGLRSIGQRVAEGEAA